MTVGEIIKKYLDENGYTGLVNCDCGCKATDLAPCSSEDVLDCKPGYVRGCQHCSLAADCELKKDGATWCVHSEQIDSSSDKSCDNCNHLKEKRCQSTPVQRRYFCDNKNTNWKPIPEKRAGDYDPMKLHKNVLPGKPMTKKKTKAHFARKAMKVIHVVVEDNNKMPCILQLSKEICGEILYYANKYGGF